VALPSKVFKNVATLICKKKLQRPKLITEAFLTMKKSAFCFQTTYRPQNFKITLTLPYKITYSPR